jgi:hypothetical protein
VTREEYLACGTLQGAIAKADRVAKLTLIHDGRVRPRGKIVFRSRWQAREHRHERSYTGSRISTRRGRGSALAGGALER